MRTLLRGRVGLATDGHLVCRMVQPWTSAPCASRSIHTPPGGFDEELPASFGKGGKGDNSNINATSRSRKNLRVKKTRRRLVRPPHIDAAMAQKAKIDLQALIKKNAAYAGRRYPAEPSIHLVGESAGDEAFFNDRIKGYFDRASAPQVAMRATRSRAAVETETLHSTNPVMPSSMLDEVVTCSRANEGEPRAASSHAEVTDEVDSVSAAMKSASLFPLDITASRVSNSSLVNVPHEEGGWKRERALERRFAVTPGSTVFGSDLDRLERDMLREYDQRGASLPAMDPVYRKFGAGRRGKRMLWEPSSSFDHTPAAAFSRNRASETTLGEGQNRNLSPYHMSAEAYRERYLYSAGVKGLPGCKGVSLCKSSAMTYGETGRIEDVGRDQSDENLPAAANPHFPIADDAFLGDEQQHYGAEAGGDQDRRVSGAATGTAAPADAAPMVEGRVIVVSAKKDYRAQLITVYGERDDFPYDAYNQRPAEDGLVELRGADYWNDYQHRENIEKRAEYRNELLLLERLTEGTMDTSEVEYSTNRIRRETLLYFQSYPINEMIQESFVRIREIVPKHGGQKIILNTIEPHDLSTSRTAEERAALDRLNMNVEIPLHEARLLARDLGLDLIRIGSLHTQKSDRRVIALCQIGDHREHMREVIKFKIQKLGVQPPPTRECIEVPFRGGIHPHGIRFKAVGIAKHLLHRHAVRLNLTKFGTPREGFPVFQTILDEVKRQCLQLKAYHKAGQIQANYNEIYCYLYPSTGRSPKTTVEHPTPEEVREARDFRVLESEKEIYFDDLHNQVTQKERLAYLTKLDRGTAWADKDEGMSLQRQRAIKVMLGYIPKGNRELYAARGDVNIPAPFRASHMTTTERWGSPAESNLEQASRGAATIGKRASMPISEMHDSGETPENPTQLDRFYYRIQGPAVEVGEFKEALGLKDNRKKRPPLSGGFGTLGVGMTSGYEHGVAAK